MDIAKFILKHFKKIFITLGVLLVLGSTLGNNNDQNWLIVQYPWGTVKVIDTAGLYWKGFGTTWRYPRYWQVEYDNKHAFKVIFNDGGSAEMSSMVRFSSPLTLESKRAFHQLFGGSEDAVETAVWAHLSDSMKSSAPVMSASEHQSARRGEFTSLVQDQLQKGLFEMRRIVRTLDDQLDVTGKPLRVYATEVVFNEQGEQKISRTSPLTDFGIVITQFSITDVVYDPQTEKQFAQKKDAFLAAEGSKAEREKEVQHRLMVEEKGRREKAETEAVAYREKAKALIEAQKEKEVEETNSARRVAVALLVKQEAETVAQQHLEVARLGKLSAIEDAEAKIILAKAQEKALQLAGAISERDRILAEIERDKQIGVARELAQIKVPQMIMSGGEGSSSDSSLLNMVLLKQLGILK